MKTVLAWIQAFAVAIGGPGLFIIAFLDSSFLSFPQVIDLLAPIEHRLGRNATARLAYAKQKAGQGA